MQFWSIIVKNNRGGAMKVLGIVAGPRKGYATDSTVDSILRGAKDSGAETEKIYLYDLDIKPCRGCGYCEKNGKCVMNSVKSLFAELVIVLHFQQLHRKISIYLVIFNSFININTILFLNTSELFK